jgi:hypothetical protein
MKTMSCKQLGGACNQKFHSETFEDMAEQSRKHGEEMFKQVDEAHIKAMNEMQKLVQAPHALTQWMESKRKEFDALPKT